MTEATLSIELSEDDHVQGESDAPLTLVEYGDYECPACGGAYPIVKNIQSRLGKDLRFVFRNFPLSQMHPHAAKAAQAAESANAQGSFWEMHDLLYLNQQNLNDEDLINYAASLGLDKARFADDLNNDAYDQKIQADFVSGVESGVNGTPTFFINGVRYDGEWRGDNLLTELKRH